MTVADVVADGLVRAGISRLFVTRGTAAGPVRQAIERRDVPSTAVAGASEACVMAAVWGGLAGVPGAVVLGDDGAAAAAGLDHALSRRLPLIALTSGAPARRTPDLTRATKATLTVTAGSGAHWIAHACQLAMTEPWGPVHLDIREDVALAASLPVATNCRPAPLPAPDGAALDAAVLVIERAERPLVIVGRLCRSDADAAWIRAFAEARPAPVLVTDGARGVLPDPHPLVIGVLGGGEPEREILASADLVVAIAVDALETAGSPLPPDTARLTLTPVAAAAGPSTVVGDVGSILEELAPRLRDRRYAEWDVARLHALKQAAALPPPGPGRLAHRVVAAVRRLTPAGTIAVFEGEGLAHAARAWQAVAPGECLIGGTFAAATAAAARLARPERAVVCFVGSPDAARDPLDPPAALRVLDGASLVASPAALDAALAAGGPGFITILAAKE
jgi:acetolactate synthase I/II/III large subunit